ncbi:MAG: hypothetical protein ACOYUZ_02160 [Patescibacteria group bacterium]
MEEIKNSDILEMKKDIRDILDTVNAFANHTEEQFSEIRLEISGIKGEIGGIKGEIGSMKGEIKDMGERLTRVEANMVTKAYLDDKLADMRGDLTAYDRQQDKKVDFLTRTLERKKVLTGKESETVVAMSPFPRAPKVG